MELHEIIFIHYGSNAFDKRKFGAIKNATNLAKPSCDSGLWACPSDSAFGWVKKRKKNDYSVNQKESFKFYLHSTANVYVIDSQKDARDLPFFRVPGDYNYYIDYEKIAQNYDAVFLTEKGLADTRFSLPVSFFSWDVESVLVLNKHKVIAL